MPATGRRRPAGVDALGLGAALLLIAALSVWFGVEPDEEQGPPDPALVVVLVDTSASAVALRADARLQIARAVRAAGREAFARGDECAVVTYADVATRRFGPSADAAGLDEVLAARTVRWTVEGMTGALGTDLDRACALALALLGEGERPPGRVVVVGDPVGTTGGPGLERLAAPGVAAVDVRPLGPVRGFDLAVEDVRAEPRIPAGAPSTVAVDLALVGPAPAASDPPRVRLDWELRASRATGIGIGEPPFLRVGSVAVEARAAAGGTVRWTAALALPATPPGTADLSVRARFVGADGTPLGDAFDVDDAGRTRWIVGDPDRVLVVGPTGE
ncbi:MAG: vWA domain-containing protein, partial [Planctomycetota bacterium]